MIIRNLACALSLAIVATPAFASPLADQVSETVKYNDLDLSTAKGREKLENRIKSKASQICETGSRNLGARQFEKNCIRSALSGAHQQIEHAIAAAKVKRATKLALVVSN